MRLENSIEESDYTLPAISKPKWILLLILVIILGFILNFSFTERIENIIRLNLTKNPSCPINYKEAKFELFFPKIILKNIAMPGRCLSPNNQRPLELKQLAINLIGPSFSPLGLNFSVKTNLEKSRIISRQTIGATSQIINTSGTILDLGTLAPILGINFKMLGEVETNALVQIENSKINNAKFLLKSKNFFVPGQKLESFEIPNLNLKNFLMRGIYDRSGKLTIDDLVLGDKGAPIYANLKGNVFVNNLSIGDSRIDLKGEIIFSPEFLESFSILKLFLGQFSQKDGYYQIKLGGTLKSPIPIQ